MQSSPTFGPDDDRPSWAVSCLFIHSGNLYTGTPSMFESLGFTDVARRKPGRPIVRLTLR